MPSAISYPGVYIEEVPSGVRTIVGVPTSITAFVGRALTGPVNEPIVINGYADFERSFGGLWEYSQMGFAVRDFFMNGGGQAVIVRLFHPMFASEEQRNDFEKAALAVKDAAVLKAQAADATPEQIKLAARTEADKYKDKPERPAADQVADAASRASIADSEAATLIAKAAREKAKTESGVSYLCATTADLVAKAAEDKAAEAGTNPYLVKKAVGDAAQLTSDSADKVAKAAEDKAVEAGADAVAVKDAASTAAGALPDGMGKKAGALVAKAAETAAAVPGAGAVAVKDAARTAAVDIQSTATGVWDVANKKSQELIDQVTKAVDAEVAMAAPIAKSKIVAGKNNKLVLEAAYEGAWGNELRVRIDYERPREMPDSMKALGLSLNDLFNLTIRNMKTGASETFRNLTVKPGPRIVDKVLINEMSIVRVSAGDDSIPENIPEATDEGLTQEDLKIKPFSDEDVKQSKRSIGVSGVACDGSDLVKETFIGTGKRDSKEGLFALERLIARDGIFNLLCIPPYLDSGSGSWDVDRDLVAEAAAYCEKRRAMLLVDSPSSWKTKGKAIEDFMGDVYPGIRSKNAAIFFPRLTQPNPLRKDQLEDFAPCGAMAGIFSRTDTQRGVWKAPAGTEANLIGVTKLSVLLTDEENGELNPLGINCLRAFPTAGKVIWGSRTLRGADQLADEWKYIPVRRLALYIEESLYRGTQWVVFEPNDEPLWAQIRLNVGAFMHNLFRQGAFQGKTPRDAYFVKCDRETTIQNDINLGIVNILVGFAPLKPAEFVIIKIQQMAGQIQT